MIRILIVALTLAFSGTAWAQDCALPKQKEKGQSYAQLLLKYDRIGCFGGEADPTDIARRTGEVRAAIKGPVSSVPEYQALRDKTAKALIALESSLGDAQGTASDEWRSDIHLVRTHLVASASGVTSPEVPIPATKWIPDSNLVFFEGALPVASRVEGDCAAGYTPLCQGALVSAGAILRHANLAHGVVKRLVDILVLEPKYLELKAMDDNWTYYFEHGRSQYPWELAVNSARYKRYSEDDRFSGPPDDQLILFHLDAALEYAQPANGGGSEFNAIAVVEVVGYNWLRYPEDGSGGRSYGASIIATVSPESDGNRVGWGAMVHFTEKFSLGVARRDLGRDRDETTWLLSADLGKLLNTTSQEERADFRAK